MGIAQAVQEARVAQVGLEMVMHDDARLVGQEGDGLHRSLAAFFMMLVMG